MSRAKLTRWKKEAALAALTERETKIGMLYLLYIPLRGLLVAKELDKQSIVKPSLRLLGVLHGGIYPCTQDTLTFQNRTWTVIQLLATPIATLGLL